MKNIKKNFFGFTLIEILIVIALIGIFATFLVVSFNKKEGARELKNNALLVIDGIKRAQTMALSGQKINGAALEAYVFSIETCGGNCHFDLKGRTDGAIIPIETVGLNPNVSVSAPAAEIRFKPPRANMELWGINPDVILTEYEINIFLSYPGISEKYKIVANRVSGRVDIIKD